MQLAAALTLACALPAPVLAQSTDNPLAAAPDPANDEAEAGPGFNENAPAAWQLRVEAPGNLDELLTRHLDLSRFRQQGDITEVEVARLIAAAPDQARALLETEGYFEPRIEVRREPAGDTTSPPLIVVRVEPGTRAVIDRLTLEIQGDFQDAVDAGQEAAVSRARNLRERWPLQPGTPFTQAAWTAAKNGLLASLRSQGYPAASYAGTVAEVDPATKLVRIFIVADSGPLFRVGELRIDGIERTTPEAVRNLAPFDLGEVFSEKMLLDYQAALQKSGLYAGVAVELDPDVTRADNAQVAVRVRENTLKTATYNIGFSTNTGPRVGVEFTHRRPFGATWVATTRLRLGRDERLAALDLLSYPKPQSYRNLFSLSREYLDAGGAVTDAQRVRYGRLQDTLEVNRLYYAEYNRTTLETDLTRRADSALWGNYEWTRRSVNDLLFPTRGLIITAHAGGGSSRDADGQSGPFGRLYARTTWYQPLGGGLIAILRGEAGEVLRRKGLGVPDTLLFRAGGDDSLRGYGFRSLGPVRDGAVVGGNVMAAGTAELMWPLSARLRDWYGATFIDAGNAADRWPDWQPVYGYGVGVRWRSPVGPLKADIAYGEDINRVRVHVSVGVSF